MALKIQPTAGEQDPGSLTLVCSIQETLYHKDRVVTGDPGEQGVELPSATPIQKSGYTRECKATSPGTGWFPANQDKDQGITLHLTIKSG